METPCTPLSDSSLPPPYLSQNWLSACLKIPAVLLAVGCHGQDVFVPVPPGESGSQLCSSSCAETSDLSWSGCRACQFRSLISELQPGQTFAYLLDSLVPESSMYVLNIIFIYIFLGLAYNMIVLKVETCIL